MGQLANGLLFNVILIEKRVKTTQLLDVTIPILTCPHHFRCSDRAQSQPEHSDPTSFVYVMKSIITTLSESKFHSLGSKTALFREMCQACVFFENYLGKCF